jgi:ribonuclease T2
MRERRLRVGQILAATGFVAILFLCRADARWYGPRDERVGQFDYFVLSLSWSPEHCAGDMPDERQCDGSRRYGFVVHGLWPQSADGPLDSCSGGGRLDPSIADGMLDLMPNPTLVRHEWKKHGACTGMPPAEYFETVRAARGRVRIPEAYRSPREPRTVDATMIRKDFVEANSALDGADLAVICRRRHLSEIRVCLDKELRPKACGHDVRDQCRGEVAVRPVR